MKVNLLGYKEVDFTNENNEHIKGTNLFVAHEDDDVTGLMTDKYFIKPTIAIPKGLELNKPFNVEFNRKGKVVSVSLVTKMSINASAESK